MRIITTCNIIDGYNVVNLKKVCVINLLITEESSSFIASVTISRLIKLKVHPSHGISRRFEYGHSPG
jgi:hypothetical protein